MHNIPNKPTKPSWHSESSGSQIYCTNILLYNICRLMSSMAEILSRKSCALVNDLGH